MSIRLQNQVEPGKRLIAAAVVICAVAGWIAIAITLLRDQSSAATDAFIYIGSGAPAVALAWRLLYVIFHYGKVGRAPDD